MKYKPISNTLFKKNRIKLQSLLSVNSIAIVHSNDQMPRNGDLFFPFRQSSDFFYLTGIEQEKSVLVLYPDSADNNQKELLFIIRPDENTEIWEGKKLTKNDAKEISGIESIFYLDEYDSLLKQLYLKADSIYVNNNENERFHSEIDGRDYRKTKALQQELFNFQFKRLAPLMQKLRLVKEQEEIELISEACRITGKAFSDVLRHVKPGMHEYEIEAIITYHYIKNGANGHAYEPIIGSGINSCYLHYTKNNKLISNGEILFMDFGAEYANYASDCSRAIPVNGKFSVRQKQVYNAVLRIFNEAKKLMTPGNTIARCQACVVELMEKELVDLNLLTMAQIKNKDTNNLAYKKYFMHGISHFMGLDTHDVGNKNIEFCKGMVLSCEPGIYIMEEELGIRIENDILITDNSPIDLMQKIPLEIDEIEALMNK
jgi:Xaa-Pro aminopeptidase